MCRQWSIMIHYVTMIYPHLSVDWRGIFFRAPKIACSLQWVLQVHLTIPTQMLYNINISYVNWCLYNIPLGWEIGIKRILLSSIKPNIPISRIDIKYLTSLDTTILYRLNRQFLVNFPVTTLIVIISSHLIKLPFIGAMWHVRNPTILVGS